MTIARRIAIGLIISAAAVVLIGNGLATYLKAMGFAP
jgi:hypothetical protein